MPNRSYAKAWTKIPPAFAALIERLQGVTIECRHAHEVIARQDTRETLFFCDPPYPMSTRNSNGKGYRFELTDEDHCLLARKLHALQGKAIISGYPCDLYDRNLYKGWRRVSRGSYAGCLGGQSPRTEVLWMNF